ncbi:MAG: DUF4340 domain-containing protein [Ruminiclostridium sp.]|nr:DUF4340 domain-containing protein [Ruminiclostridium sp.]
MKLYRNAIILAVIVALLGGAYYFISRNKKPDGSGSDTRDIIRILDYTSDKIEKVTVENTEGTFVITKKDKNWELASPADFKADASKLSSIVINASSVIADKVVDEDAKDLSLYGLGKPVQITLKITDGTEKTLQIGDETPTKGGYYAKLKNSGKVYVIDTYTAETLLVKRLELKDKTLYTLKPEDVISVSMDRKGSNLFKAQKNGDADWQMLAPIQGNMNASALGPMIDAFTKTTISEYIEENPADLSKYGLANPAYIFDFSTSSANYRLLLGSEKEKGSLVYAKLEGSNDVFTISETAYNFLDKPLKEIIEIFAYIVNIDQVNKIELTMDRKTTTFGLDVYKDAEGKTDTDKDKFTMNGKDASMKDKDDKQPFRTFYQALIGIGLDEIDVGDVPMSAPEVTVKYYLKSAPGTMKVDLVSKDANYYYVFRNDAYTGILVKKNKQDFGVEGLKATYKILEDAVNAKK